MSRTDIKSLPSVGEYFGVKICRGFKSLNFRLIHLEGPWYVPHCSGQHILRRLLLPNEPAASLPGRFSAETVLFDAAHPSVGLRDLLVYGEPAPLLHRLAYYQVLAGQQTVQELLRLPILSLTERMRPTKVRSLVFTDPVHSSGSRLLLVIVSLIAISHYFIVEGSKLLENWDNDYFWMRMK